MTPILRAYDAKLDVEVGSRTIVSTINTASVDRYNTVILPTGARLDAYRKNPVVPAMHNGQNLPIGKNLWIKVQKDRLIAKTQFLPAGVDEFADKIFRLYQDGFLNAWSIGMNPIEWGKPTTDEIRKNPEWAGADIIFRAWELLEYSAVTVPGNADCLTEAVSRGLALPGWEIPVKPELPPLIGRSYKQVLAATVRDARNRSKDIKAEALEIARGMV